MKKSVYGALLLLVACASEPTKLADVISSKEPSTWAIEENYITLAEYHELRFKPDWIGTGSKLDDIVTIDEENGTAQIALGVYAIDADWTMCVMILTATSTNTTEISAFDGGTSTRCDEFFEVLLNHPNNLS